MLTRRILIQLAIFAVVAVVAGAIMVFGYLRLPNLLFGVGHYEVTVQLPEAVHQICEVRKRPSRPMLMM